MKLCKDCIHCRIPMIQEPDFAKHPYGGKIPEIPDPDIDNWECLLVSEMVYREVDGIGILKGVRDCIDARMHDCNGAGWIKKEEPEIEKPVRDCRVHPLFNSARDCHIKEVTRVHKEIISQREEIITAFIAKYNCEPNEVVQIVSSNEKEFVWSVRKKSDKEMKNED